MDPRWRRVQGLALAPVLIFLGSSCGPSIATKKSVNAMIASRDYAAAEAHLQRVKESQYGRKNAVLYYLDVGTVQHHAGKYRESDRSFDAAETRMQELYTKSVTKAAGSVMINDYTMDYAGEVFERALTNVFRALNYVYLGQLDEALVESRKVEVYLDELGRHREKRRVYKDDAFARYLDGMLYEDAGKTDDARISFEAAARAYKWYARDYNTPPPAFDRPAGEGDAEVVLIHYAGVAPRKISKTFQVAWNKAMLAVHSEAGRDDPELQSAQFKNALAAGVTGKSITVSYPEFVQDPFSITASEISVDGRTACSVLMEDISAIAFKDLSDRQGAIRARSIARAAVKYIIAQAATQAAEKEWGKNSWGAILTKVTTNVGAAASEVADTRGWSAVPSQIRMARLRVPAGTHRVTARFLDGAGTAHATRVFENVAAKAGRRVYLHHRTACEPACEPPAGGSSSRP